MIKQPKALYSKREKFKDEFGGFNNECYTPANAIIPLIKYIPLGYTIWDCDYGSGRLAHHFSKEGFKVIGDRDQDFLTDEINPHAFNIIITNPPYSLKNEFLKRAFEIGKPFAFLLPLTALEGIKRGKMFREKNIQLIIPNRRINFEIPSGKKSSWFATAWFCYKMNLPKDLNFVELER